MGIKGDRSSESMIKQSLVVGTRTYEQRYNRCGKRNCRTCYHRPADYCGPPGHGPYWYLCITFNGRWRRLYIGKELDTAKFIQADGSIDWVAFKNRATRKDSP